MGILFSQGRQSGEEGRGGKTMSKDVCALIKTTGSTRPVHYLLRCNPNGALFTIKMAAGVKVLFPVKTLEFLGIFSFPDARPYIAYCGSTESALKEIDAVKGRRVYLSPVV